MLLKGKLARRSWPIDTVVGADWMGRGSDSPWRRRGFRIGMEWATILLQKSHNRATIVIWSWSRSSSESRLRIVEVIPRWRSHDLDSVAPRSRFDRATIVDFFHESSQPSDGDRDLMKIWRARELLAASMETVWWRSIARWSAHRSMSIVAANESTCCVN